MTPKTSAQPDPQKKYMRVPAAHFKVLDEEQGIVEAIVNTYSIVDYAGDRTIPGCCEKSLERKMPTICWMHDWMQTVGKTIDAADLKPGDERLPEKIRSLGGLYVKGQFNLKTTRGRDAFYDVLEGVVDEYSIGYYEVKTKYAKDGALDLEEIDLVEWSPVLRGCNPITFTMGAKAHTANTMKTRNQKPPNDGQAHIKSNYLGYYAEADASMAAIRQLNYRLMYYALYDLLYYEVDEGESLDAQMVEIGAAFDEFRDISIKFVRTAMEAGNASVDLAAKSLRELYPDPDAASPAGAAYEKQLDTTLAAVNDCIARGKSIAALRAQTNRTLSGERQEQIEGLKSALDTLLADARRAPESETSASQIKAMERKQRLRELNVSL